MMWLMKRNCLIYLVQFYKTLTELRETEQTHISYNFIMTLNYMLMIPRSKGNMVVMKIKMKIKIKIN